jgi:beta-glucanase (GH16 family)
VWSDEFNDPDIDSSIWTYDVGGGGFGNGQLEHNTARMENSYIENGNLVLEARRENYSGNSFTSARMLAQGRFAFKYGTLEARIKLPDTANGLWPAFWLLGNNFGPADWPVCGEIDIVEMGSAAGIAEGLQQEKINCAMHFSDVADTYQYYDSWLDAPVDLSLDYHLYKVEWTPTDMTFYLDGVVYGSWDITPAYLSEFHEYAFPILNIAIGGWNYVQINDPGLITATFPAKMYIDWIRLEDNAFTEILFGADNEETVNFGVYTDTTPVNNSLTYGVDADLFIWNNMIETTTTAYEGSNAWSFDIAGGVWYGMGVNTTTHRNMNNYSDGSLHFQMKSTTTEAIKVGVKSSVGDEFWLPLGDETAEFGFARDGNWHEVIVPLNRFANTDFPTIHQMFMLAGDPPASGFNVSIDNVYWEESVARPTPANGNFGVYTETVANKDAGEFILGVEGDFFIWADTLLPTTQTPYEGTESISLTSAPALSWFGAAFTPNVKHNLTAFRYPASRLHFAMKTSSTTTFQVGMKSGNVDGIGQQWITFASGSDPYGFVRDGNWHVVEIPMSDIITEVDLFEVSQLFQILGTTGPITGIEIDDVAFTGGGDPLTTPGGGNIPPTVSITSPVGGTFFNPGENVLIEADASDADGTVTKVEFFEGANLLGEDLTSPYSFTVNSVTEGTYSFTAAATDSNDVSRTSSSVTVYVGTPELTTINVSPPSATVKAEQSKQFTAAGLDQFGLEFPVTVNWSVSGGGLIDGSGLFSAVVPGGPYTVTATDTAGGILSDTASVTVEAGGICSGDHPNGEFSWEASGDTTNPTLTFIPSGAGIGNTVLLLQYGRIPDGGFPGNWATPNVPFQINAIEGEKIYFYYTYNTPTGEHNTMDSKLSFVVGDCQTADTIVPVPNPLTWSVLPYATGETSVSMTATTALDASGVEYYFANVTNPAHDSGWQASSVYDDTGLTASTTYSYTVTARDLSVNQNQGTASTTESATTDTETDGQLPYFGTPLAIPGQIEAEDFDLGGQAIAYSDSDVGNNGGAYRPSEDVDLEICSEGGYNLGWIRAGEWVEYTVDVSTAGDYTLDIRAAAMNAGGAFHIEFDGVDKTSTIAAPVTGGWQNWTTLTTTVTLSAGVQIMSFVNESAVDAFNLNYFDLTYNSPVDTTPPTPNPAGFSTAPNATGTSSIAMVATTGSDASDPVEYYFACTSGGGNDSGWQTSTSYTDTGLSASTQYTYTVQMRDALGNTGTASSGASATTDTPPDTTPPTPNPAGFATAPNATGTSSIAMVATTGSDASGPVEYYFTETSGNSGGTSSAWQTSTSYTDSGLNASTQYTYTVTMRDALGNTGTASSGASATTNAAPDTTPPTPNPAGFATAPNATGTSSIAMVATTGSDASGPVEYYFACTSGGGNDSGWQTSTSYADTGLTPDTSYTYTVQMRDSLGNTGTASSGANATTDPDTGGLCTGEPANGDYTWEATGDLNNPSITFIPSGPGIGNSTLLVYYSLLPEGAYPGYFTTPNTPFQITASQGQLVYFYYTYNTPTGQHSTVDDKHTIVIGDCQTVDTTPPTPNPASFATAPNATGTSSIAMVATTGSDTSGPVEYLFTETSGNPGGSSSAWQTSTSYTDTGLNASTQYTYTVTMRDALGNAGTASSGASATTDAAPDTTPPTPNPAGFATAPNATGTSSIAMVATTGSDASGPVEYYFACTSGGGNDSGWQTSTSYADTGLTPDTSYTYTVQMRDSLGNTGTASSGASATTDAASVPPAAPSNLSATAISKAQIDLSWTDNATDETGFKIERSKRVNTAFVQIATVGQDVTSYSDMTVRKRTLYYYRVRATNADGDSVYSNEASANTPK